MNIETTLWFNMKRRRPLKYKFYYKFTQNQESFNTVNIVYIARVGRRESVLRCVNICAK